jgi:integrase
MRIYRPESTRPIPDGAKVNGDKKTVTYKGRDGEIVRAVLTDGGKMRVNQGVWHIAFRDGLDRQQDIAAFEHEGRTRLLASRIQTLIDLCGEPMPTELREYTDRLLPRIKSALQDCGLLPREQTPIVKPLDELIGMYEQALRSRERNVGHICQTIKDVRQVFEACGFHQWQQIKDDKVESYLRDLREGEKHLSYGRSNGLLTACQSFANWIVNSRKWANESPLRGIHKLNAQEDRRRTARALSVDDMKKLMYTTAGGPKRYGMSGRERYLLYRFVIETGLRRGEIQRLRRADFDFDAMTVTVRAEKASKNKQRREQALSPGLCAELKDFMASKLPDAKAFGGSFIALTDKTANMLKADLADADIPYKDDHGDVFHFHALRGECASLLINSGCDPKQAQEIMRHSSIGLTMDTYAKVLGGKKKAQAIASLPDLSLPQKQILAKTGTSDAPEIYGELYSQDKSHRIESGSIGQVNRGSEPITALATQNQRSDCIVVPRVAGPNPVSHPCC